MRQGKTAETFDTMVAARRTNLRQLLQAATRRLNMRIAQTLRSGGYDDITATHTMLLSNMTLDDDTVTSISQRASVSPQAVGRLVAELEERGYVRTTADDNDARRRRIVLTVKGRKLMKSSFAILNDIERELEGKIGVDAIDTLRRSLTGIASN